MFELQIQVSQDLIDANGHVNNVRFVQWMQDIAVAHSKAVGCDARYYHDLNATWVARTHRIEYFQPAMLNDLILISTHIARFRKVSCFRHYLFQREQDKLLLAEAETEWVFLQTGNGRPRRIDEDIKRRFGVNLSNRQN